MRIFISAGEQSGDLHGANLAESLRERIPGVELVGFGGDRMTRAGVKLLYPLTELAVMWFGQTLRNIHKFFHLGAKAESFFRNHRPDAVVLIDYPGFHWHIAQRAHKYRIPVYYYVPPQLWAWAGWRVKKVRRNFTAVLTALPFEEIWYRERGVRTHYVGHPYFDEIDVQNLDPGFLADQRVKPGPIVALLPGSRGQEVLANFPMMVEAAKKIHAARPDVRFLVASYKEKQAIVARQMLEGVNVPVEVHVGRTPEIIELATACIAVSGSVSLELLVRLKPTVVVYKMTKWFKSLGARLIKVRYISLVNLLADARIYPEYPTTRDESATITLDILKWLNQPAELDATIRQLSELRSRVAIPGAVDRAADFLTSELT